MTLSAAAPVDFADITQLIAAAHTQAGLRGFTRANLFRMRQFYETYQAHESVAPLARLLPWTHNLIIPGQSKRPDGRYTLLVGGQVCA